VSEPKMVEVDEEQLAALERAADALRALCEDGITIDNANEAQEALEEVAQFYEEESAEDEDEDEGK
jgi:cobalamin-dependent methionine synthase I